MTVRVERRVDASDQDAAAAAVGLRVLVKNMIGVSVQVEVMPPEGVERSTGKMRRIVDERPAR